MGTQEKYNPKNFENKWVAKWLNDKLFRTPDDQSSENGKFYSLYSFPYPSGSGLHVGHVEGMVANDIAARYYRMKGRAVTLPMGWDSFGLPAENYAIKTGTPPQISTEDAIKTFISQINHLGISVDWEKELGAHRPEYYKWTQWIFIQLYKAGLAYKKIAPVNWCPKDQTVLANEQIINGRCERCDTEVIQKELDQWFFKITDFADRLDKDLDKVDWPESTKSMQKNWIGKSTGVVVKFRIKFPDASSDEIIKIFTTRVDTIYSAAFLVLAPESEFIQQHKKDIGNYDEVNKYIEESKNKTDLQRQQEKDKTGVKIEGLEAVNPINNELLPIYIADFVLGGYGTGAVMGMPGHDQRDFEFSKKFNLPVKYTLKPKDENFEFPKDKAYEGEGYEINSGEFDGLWWEEAREKIIDKLEKEGKAIRKTNYKIRDWLVSRQRYWGCPIPIVYDPEGNPHAVDESDLPVLLPTDVDFLPTGESPIKLSAEFKKRAEDKYGKGWHYEFDTMDTFVDSSWYYFRFCDVNNQERPFDADKVNFWLPTDLYMIGAEHTVLHLLYSRFFTKFFFDQGLIKFGEPFYKMRHMGTILGPDGKKMSKRWGNVINPTDEIERFSADALRMYEMFMGPLEDSKAWNDRAENGVFRFLSKVWDMQYKVTDEQSSQQQEKEINKLIIKVDKDIETLSFNTAVAKYMEFINFLSKEDSVNKQVWEKFLLVLAPYAPFITEELWSNLGNKYSIHQKQWPDVDSSITGDETVKIAVQVNGKLKSAIELDFDSSEESVKARALDEVNVKKYITSEPRKVIFVKNKIINFIV